MPPKREQFREFGKLISAADSLYGPYLICKTKIRLFRVIGCRWTVREVILDVDLFGSVRRREFR